MASVEVVDMRREVADARRLAVAKPATGAGPAAPKPQAAEVPDAVPLSTAVAAALRENLGSGGQSMVFLNRRGFHNFLQCHICGNVIACPNCSVSMTFHMRDRSLRCHYCGNHTAAPDTCPECHGYGLKGQGFGTERLTQALAEMMPAARIERMDSDTSSLRGARARMLAELRAGEIDILVGTQMITKGFDFPGVTLAAVVNADLALNMPDFRSAERTFQLLTQVAGRAGRGERPGRERSGLRALHAARAATAPRPYISAVCAPRDDPNRGRRAAHCQARGRGGRQIVGQGFEAGGNPRAGTRACADRADQAALPVAGDGKIARIETDARGDRRNARRSRTVGRARRHISCDRHRSRKDAVTE